MAERGLQAESGLQHWVELGIVHRYQMDEATSPAEVLDLVKESTELLLSFRTHDPKAEDQPKDAIEGAAIYIMDCSGRIWGRKSSVECVQNASALHRRLTEEYYGVPPAEQIVLIASAAWLKKMERIPQDTLGRLLRKNRRKWLRIFPG
ncbi:MAG: hypothetical protein U1A16_00620 [Patescibacteria group bacterium]|nr:hypothetical protein [Patescibacteria group bacterium]MDZ4295857.1 hypothetical protein [Patescibacteria group bacterium]